MVLPARQPGLVANPATGGWRTTVRRIASNTLGSDGRWASCAATSAACSIVAGVLLIQRESQRSAQASNPRQLSLAISGRNRSEHLTGGGVDVTDINFEVVEESYPNGPNQRVATS